MTEIEIAVENALKVAKSELQITLNLLGRYGEGYREKTKYNFNFGDVADYLTLGGLISQLSRIHRNHKGVIVRQYPDGMFLEWYTVEDDDSVDRSMDILNDKIHKLRLRIIELEEFLDAGEQDV